MLSLQPLLESQIVAMIPCFEVICPEALKDVLAHPFAREGVR